jgi:hypothetical protein
MIQHGRTQSNRSIRGAGLPAVVVVAAIATVFIACSVPLGRQPAAATYGSFLDATLIGEHSALGERLVDDRNAAIAAATRVHGEHAGLTREEYLSLSPAW